MGVHSRCALLLGERDVEAAVALHGGVVRLGADLTEDFRKIIATSPSIAAATTAALATATTSVSSAASIATTIATAATTAVGSATFAA